MCGIALAWASAFGAIPLVLFWMMRGASPSAFFWTIFWCYFLLIYKLTAWLSDKYRARQRNIVVNADTLLSNDPRPHVLYLRTFRDDETTSRLLGLSTEEQDIATVMLELGPFVAIGEPGEALPDPGAARIYVADEHWQATVTKLMATAQLVVARIGLTESFLWEMLTAVEIVGPKRLLLLVPEDKDVYETFRRHAAGVLPCQLPEYEFKLPVRDLSKSYLSIGGFLYFDQDWTPHLQKFKTPYLRQSFWNPIAPGLKLALRPVYERLGVAWQRPPLQPVQFVPMLFLLIFLGFALYVMALQLLALRDLLRSHF